MLTVSSAKADSSSVQRIAHPLHTIVFLAAEGALVVRAAMHAEQMRDALIKQARLAVASGGVAHPPAVANGAAS